MINAADIPKDYNIVYRSEICTDNLITTPVVKKPSRIWQITVRQQLGYNDSGYA